MKRTLTLLVFSMTLWAAQAQLSDGTISPEFTVTDIDGNQHVLYDYLNEGKVVIIDIFATWCGPCWTLHSNHVLENIYEQYGPDGTNEIMVMSIEGDNSTSHADLLGTGGNTQGDWTNGISFPIIEDTSIPGTFNLTYWPTIYVIRPDGALIVANDYCWLNLFEPGQDWVYNLAFRGENDALIRTTQTDRILCGATNYTGSARVKNMGSTPLTSAVVSMLLNGEVAQTKTWTGNLAEFKEASVFFTPVALSQYTDITFEVSMPNEADDMYTYDNEAGLTYDFPIATTALEFSITTDFWPEEVSWELQDANGSVLYSNEEFGDLLCNTTYSQTFELNAEGCHKLVLSDAYGDGVLNGSINPGSVTNPACLPVTDPTAMGAVSLISNGVVLFDNISYGSGIQVPFDFDMSSSIQPIPGLESVQIFPNPAQSYVDVELNLNQNSNITMQVLDVTGKLVMSRAATQYPAGSHIEHLDVSRFANGTYFVRLTQNNNVNTLKFTVIN